MSSPNERPGFSSTCTMKGESAMVVLLSYALRREQRALSWCRVSGEGTNVVRYRTIIQMTRGFLGIRQIPARLAAVFRAIGARYRHLVAWIGGAGALSPSRVLGYAMRTYSGHPRSSIRFSTLA